MSAIYVPIIHPVVTKEDQKAERPWILFFDQLSASANQTQRGTHAQRVADPRPLPGTIWYETDRETFYYLDGAAWRYAGGEMTAPLAEQPTDLGASDAGFRLAVEDYADLVQWDGATWNIAPGAVYPGATLDRLIGTYTVPSVANPRPPGWAPLDGKTVELLVLGPTLTTVSVVTSELGGMWIKR